MSSLFDILDFAGIGLGSVQSDDEMTVIPLVGGDRGDVASPSSLKFERTTGYGEMKFSNEDEKPAIVPSNMMIRGTGAQDHAMSGSGIVKANSSESFNNACCIEETQGGLLSATGNDEDILPIGLRKPLLDYGKRSEKGYSKLWHDIKGWLRGMNLGRRSAAHLRYFYDDKNINQALEEFAASFEPIENQIGAVIMFNGVPVGIEIMPSADHWDAYWQQLLRGCYGAELLRMKRLGKIAPSTLILPNIPEESSGEHVKEILIEFTNHLREEIIPILEQISVSDNRRIGSITSGLETRMITTDSGGGDVILQDSKPIYISLVL